MKIQAVKTIRYQGVEHKPNDTFEVPDFFANSFIKRGLAKPAPKKKTKSKVE